jgi:hypothetical protein
MTRFLPILLLLGLYWPGLTNWFYQDDFGWLRLRQEVHSARDLAPALFAPKAHGNMRPLGENAYWLGLSSLFGAEALPFRICAFLTQIASLLLLGSIVLRLTGSRAAVFWAQILWIANCGLAPAMSWSSIYNQVLSGFFFLLAFYFLLRRVEWAHWAAFVLGLGALETNVVYPVLAACYALLYDRPRLRRIAPMFLVSALFVWVHFHFAGAQGGVYAMHFDGAMIGSLWTYWSWALGRGPLAAALALSAATLAFIVWRASKRDYLALFGLAWFVIVLAPYLPLRDHKMDYYLAVPAIGIAIIGAAAVVRAPRAAAALAIAAYLAVSLPAAWTATRWNHDRSRKAADLVLGAAEIRRHDPGKIILLDGIDTDLFSSGIADAPFLALQIPYVYLAPGAEAKIQAPADLVSKFELPPGMALDALKGGRAVVYRMDGGVLRNSTARYRSMADGLWKAGPPRFVNLGDPLFDSYLGPGWNAASNGYRSMRQTASLRMGGASSVEERLYVGVFRTRDFQLALRVNGSEVPVELLRRDNELSLFRAPLPGASEWIEVTLSANVAEPVVFGFVEVR